MMVFQYKLQTFDLFLPGEQTHSSYFQYLF